MKIIYLVRHSSPFVEIDNYEAYENVLWNEYNKNMILSVQGEEKAQKLCEIEELKNIKNIYSSNSFRAIATAKYLSESNKTKIKLDDRINEREFGIKYLNELPSDFTEHSFKDKNFKVNNGESLNDIDLRFNSFIEDILQKNEKSIVVIHGIMLLSFLQNHCDFKFVNGKIYAKYNKKEIIYEKPKSLGVYKIIFNDNNFIVDIDCLINSKFIELFGNPIKNERNWNKYLLSELGTLKNGMNYSKESQNYKIKFLGVSEFKYGDIINDSSYLQDLYLTEKPEQISLLKNNDILFVRSNGSKDLVGRSLIFVDIEEDVTFSGFCIRFRNESKLINPRFLIKLFQNEEFKKSLKKDSRGANINNINQQMLSNLPIIVPPLELQNNFVDLVMNLEQIKIIIDKNSNELDTLYIKKVSEYFN